MSPPPVTIYVTSLTSHPTVRSHTELLHRSLTALKIPYEAFDLVMDEAAKTRWQRAKPVGKVIGLPGYLVAGEWIGTMNDFEEAVETGTLPQFLKQDLDLDTANAKADASDNITQAELNELMKGMSENDLEQLAGEMGAEPGLGTNQQSDLHSSTAPENPGSSGMIARTLPEGTATPLDPPAGKTADRRIKEHLAKEIAQAGSMDQVMSALEEAEGK